MKAIQIRYLAPTNTQGARFKAFSEAGSLIRPREYDLEPLDQAKLVAYDYLVTLGWADHSYISGFGSLPSGDYVATLSPRP